MNKEMTETILRKKLIERYKKINTDQNKFIN